MLFDPASATGSSHTGSPQPACHADAACRGTHGHPDGSGCGHADTVLPHRCPQGVHGRRRVAKDLPGAGPRSGIFAVRSPFRGRKRAIRRSVDRRHPPTRRNPEVPCGATATLTAPSTAGQRRGPLAGRVGDTDRPVRLRRAAPRSGRSGWIITGRGPPGLRRHGFLGYAGRSLWAAATVMPACASRAEQVMASTWRHSNQPPGVPGRGHRRSRSTRACPPTGGRAPSMSCSGSTS